MNRFSVFSKEELERIAQWNFSHGPPIHGGCNISCRRADICQNLAKELKEAIKILKEEKGII